MARRTTAWTALAVAALAASAAAGAHAARDLKYAAIGEEAFGADTWAADLIEAGLDPLIEQLSRPSIDRITNWATAQTSGTFA